MYGQQSDLGATNNYSTFMGSTADQSASASTPGLAAYPVDEGDSATDSDTISSVGDTNYDFADIAHMSTEEQQQELFWAYEQAKGRWRKFMKKPVRRVRRFFRHTMRSKGKGKGKGKRLSGKGISTCTTNLSDEEYAYIFR